MKNDQSNQLEHQFPPFRAFVRPESLVPPEPEARTWRQRVEAAAMYQPINQVTLHRLRALEDEIRHEAAARREETREHVEAIMLVCAFKMQIMQSIEDAREEVRYWAQREGRGRYVD